MAKVLVTPTTLTGIDGPHLDVLREAGFEVGFPTVHRQLTEEDLLRDMKGIVATVAGSEPYSRRVLEQLPDLRVIARAGVGYDAVDMTAATERGIAVAITPGTNHDAVAEQTFGMILALAKNIVPLDISTRAGKWKREPSLALRDRTLGILGLGRIGKAVALLGKAFKMRLLAYEPMPDHGFIKQLGIELAPLERVFAEADFLTLHLPMSAATKYLINKKTLALMKPASYLVNTARGGLVCEADLLRALKAKQIAGAALDVFEIEPCYENPLFQCENAVLMPHTAGVDDRSRIDMGVLAAQAIAALRRGEWPSELIVNNEIRDRFRW